MLELLILVIILGCVIWFSADDFDDLDGPDSDEEY